MKRYSPGIVNRAIGAAVLAVFCMAPLFPQSADALALAEKRKSMLRYGIDSEITELLKQLNTEKDDSLNDEILTLFRKTKNLKLKQSILEFYSNRIWTGAEADACEIVGQWMDQEESLVISALEYGTATKSKALLEAASPIFGEDEQNLLPALVKLSGAAGGEGESQRLIALYRDDASSDSLKQSIILALGASGGTEAIDLLIGIAENTDEGKFPRMYACDSLGRIGDPRAIDSLVNAANDKDPNIRVYALSALASFADPRAVSMLVEGLRDSFDAARIQSAKSIGKLKIMEAEQSLLYKLANDSNMKMKEESMRALAELGTQAAWDAITARLSDAKIVENLRLLSLRLILEKKRSEGYQAVRTAINAELLGKNQSLQQRMALAVCENENPGLEDLALAFMNSKDFIIRAYGTDWAKRNRSTTLRSDLERLLQDPSDLVRKRAEAALSALKANP